MLFVTNVAPKIKKTKQNLFYPPPLSDLKQKYANCIKQNNEFLSIIVQFQWGFAQ